MTDIIDLKQDVKEILALQREQMKDIATIKANQKNSISRIDALEIEQKENTKYRYKLVGALAILSLIFTIFSGWISKKI